MILVALKKGNHSGEEYVTGSQRKDLYRRVRDSLEGPHEEAEIQHKALRRGKQGCESSYFSNASTSTLIAFSLASTNKK